MDAFVVVRFALVARLLIVGTRAGGSTAAVNSPSSQDTAPGTDSEGLSCFDWKGNLIKDQAEFTPNKQDPCEKCLCHNGQAILCQTARCSPPICEMWEQLSDECCRFHCIKPPQEPGMNNNKKNTTFVREPQDIPPPSNADDDTTNLGLRLVASTVTSFLILALLLFMIHRLRRRRMLLMMRRLSTSNRRENGSDVVAAAYVSEYDDINIGVEIPPYEDPPPPYSPPRPLRSISIEAPPPYETLPRGSPGDVSEVGFRNVQSQTQDTMMRTSASQVRILDHGDRPNDNAHVGQVDNNNVHSVHDMNQNPIADINQNRIVNLNNVNGATTQRSQVVHLPETQNIEVERLRRSDAPRQNRDSHNYENVDLLRNVPVHEPMYENIETLRRSLVQDVPDGLHDRHNRNVERHSCYIDRERGRVCYERTRGRASSSDTESTTSRRGYDTLEHSTCMSTDSSRPSSVHQSFSLPRSTDTSPLPVSVDVADEEHDSSRRRPPDPRTSYLKRSGEMEVRRLRDSPRNSFCLDDSVDLDEIDLRPPNPQDSRPTRQDRLSVEDPSDRHRRPCYRSNSRTSKIVLEDSEDRKIIWNSPESSANVSVHSATHSETGVSDTEVTDNYISVPVQVPTPKKETPTATSPSRFRVGKFLDSTPVNLRHSTYAAAPPMRPNEVNKDTPGMHRRSLPPMSLSLGLPETRLPSYHDSDRRGERLQPKITLSKDNEPDQSYNYHNKLSRLKPDASFSPYSSPDVYPGATHFSSPLTPVQSSSCNSPNHYSCQGATPLQSPITPGTPLHPIHRSNSLISQASFLSICSETGEKRKRKHPSLNRNDGAFSSRFSVSHNSLHSNAHGNPRKYPSMGSVLPPALSCECDKDQTETFQNCRLHNSDRQKAESSYSVHSCPDELPVDQVHPGNNHAFGGARPKVPRNLRARNMQKPQVKPVESSANTSNLNTCSIKPRTPLGEVVDNLSKPDSNTVDDNGNPTMPEKRPSDDNLKPSDSPDRYRKIRRRELDPSTKFKQYGFIDRPEVLSTTEPKSSVVYGVEFIPELSKQIKSKSTSSIRSKSSERGANANGRTRSVEREKLFSADKTDHDRSHSAERAGPKSPTQVTNNRPVSLTDRHFSTRPNAISGFNFRRTRRNSGRRRSSRRKARQTVSFDNPNYKNDTANPITSRRSRSLERRKSGGPKREESPGTMIIRPGREGTNPDISTGVFGETTI